jgi:hypothetical protein
VVVGGGVRLPCANFAIGQLAIRVTRRGVTGSACTATATQRPSASRVAGVATAFRQRTATAWPAFAGLCREQNGALPSIGPVMAPGVTAGERLGPKLPISVIGGWICLPWGHY